MLTASIDKTARLWEPETGQCKQVLDGHTDEIFCCAFNYDGNTIITGENLQVFRGADDNLQVFHSFSALSTIVQ